MKFGFRKGSGSARKYAGVASSFGSTAKSSVHSNYSAFRNELKEKHKEYLEKSNKLKPKHYFFSDRRGQIALEAIIAGVVGIMYWAIVAGYVYNPIMNVLTPAVENAGTNGLIGVALVNLTILVIIPLALMSATYAGVRGFTQPRY